MNSDVFCPLPWVLQATRNDGVFRVCAHAQNSPCRGEARDQNGSAVTADQSIWTEARNAPTLKNIRAEFLKNKWPEACQRCALENKSGISSRQAEEVKRYKNVFEKSDAFQVTSQDGEIQNFGPRELDLRFGNRCNLKCTMCSPKSSDLWYQDQFKVWGPSFKNWREETVALSQGAHRVEPSSSFDEWYKSPHFLEQVKAQLNTVRKIHFSGGEPLLIKTFYDVLELVAQSEFAHETTIEVITNGTLLPEKLLALFPKFKKINIGVSIDAVGSKNEYIRFPTHWQTVSDVLEKLDATLHTVDPWIATTCMVYNILDLPELILWRDEMQFSKINNNTTRPILMDHPLHNPGFLSTQILPLPVKEKIARRLFSFVEEYTTFKTPHLSNNFELARGHVRSIIQSQVQFMMAEDKSHLLPKFFKYTQKLDSVRGNSFWKTFPELSILLQPYFEDHNARAYSPEHI